MIPLWGRTISIICWRRAAYTISFILPAISVVIPRTRIRAPVISRVLLECAGRGSALVARRARRIVLAVILALAGEVAAALVGERGWWFVVIWACGRGAWWSLGGRGVVLRHHLRSLVGVNLMILFIMNGIYTPAQVRHA
jgi:hypothetical protein